MLRDTHLKVVKNNEQARSYYDYTLLILVIFLSCFGLVMIYSTSAYNATRFYDDPTLYLRQQGRAIAIGIPLMILVSKIDYRIYIRPFFKGFKLIHVLYLLCMGLQIYVLLGGHEAGGAQRWIRFGAINFQPSEITKICFILFVSYLAQLSIKRLDKLNGFLLILLYMVPLLGLVVGQNLSTAIVLFFIMTVICFVASRKKLYFVFSGLFAVAAGTVFIITQSFRSTRVMAWLDIEANLSGDGYQIMQGLYAIASGGLFGKGLGESMQKLGYIPDAHTDMIFSVVCEELGLFGAVAVLLLFAILIWRLYVISTKAPDLYGTLITTGIMAHVAIQVIINIAVVTNSMPATGIPMPFISYGGSSLIVLMAEIGVALSVSNRIVKE